MARSTSTAKSSMNHTKKIPIVIGTCLWSSLALLNILLWATIGPCLSNSTYLEESNAIISLARPCYENEFSCLRAGHPGTVGGLAMDDSVSQSAENHPPASGGGSQMCLVCA